MMAPPVKKQRKETAQAGLDHEERLEKLEKKDDRVKELKEKVRNLCLQQMPSTPLILLTLDELTRAARRADDIEADLFEELARQANRHQEKINLSNLCLSVMGGKAADAISKAMVKCLKEGQDSKETTPPKSSKTREQTSPMNNLYPQMFPAPQYGMMNLHGHMQPPFQGHVPGFYNYQRGFGGYRGRGQFRPRGNCHACNSPSHQVKDCEKLKAMNLRQ